MLTRRLAVSAAFVALAAEGRAAGDFNAFVAGVKAEARKAGISQATLDQAFAGVVPNQKVIDRDRKQPEFSMTWERYRALVVTDKRIAEGRIAVARERELLARTQARFGVGAGVIAGIWGLESSYGQITGDFRVIEALATLAWEGRRASFFRGELMAALKILEQGDITPARMTGSYAGAMGQPQFMPSSYVKLAVDADGDGRRDIWTSRADVFGSIGNYLAKSGWRNGEGWGQQVTLPAGFEAGAIGREQKRPLSEWVRMGVRPRADHWFAAAEAVGSIVAPDGVGGEAFLALANFHAIRRYNPSDYYAVAVGLVGDAVLT